MKNIKIILAAIFFTATSSLSSYAQIDVKTFNGMSDAQIRSLLGEPTEYCIGEEDGGLLYYYPHATIALTESERMLDSFSTDSPEFCILSKYIPGGVKVGDPFSKLQEVDFSKVDYGRNDPENALSPDSDPILNFVIFKNEYHHVSFRVEDGIIKEWIFITQVDANPSETFINFWE